MAKDDDEPFDDGPDEDADYEVGYRKPPKQYQFGQPGVKGNPAGRARGSRQQNTMDRIFKQKVRMKVDGVLKRVPIAEAVFMQLSQRALSGDPSAVREFMRLVAMYEAGGKRKSPAEAPSELPPPIPTVFYGIEPPPRDEDDD
jgi:hypothetical protein